jgi:copper chaperone CopZ
MTEGFEYELDLLALGVGLVSAVIATAWTLIPSLVPLGPQAGVLARNKLWLQLAGVSLLLLVSLVRVWRTSDGSWQETDTSMFTQGGATLLIGVVLVTQIVAPVAADITATSPETAPGLNGASQSPEQSTATQQATLKIVHLDITGMTCPGCANSISTYIAKQPGVKNVDITFAKRGGTVVYNPQTISAKKLANSRVFQGYYNATITNVENYHGTAQ